MEVIYMKVNGLTMIGKSGESMARSALFRLADFGAVPSAGVYQLWVRRFGDAAPYPVPVTVGDGFVRWDVGEADTEKVGRGVAELLYVVDGAIYKSCDYFFYVASSITAPGSDLPPEEPWVQRVIDAAAFVEESAAYARAVADMEVEGVELEPGGGVHVEKIFNPDTMELTLKFSIAPGAPGEDGEDGEDGAPGAPGFSPTVTVTDIEGGHRVTITDESGAHVFDVMDGSGDESPVQSVNGKTGDVVLDAEDVGALPDDTVIPEALADLTADSTHRVVTDAEKAVWSGKQDAISDLSTIRTGAAAGATAVQPDDISDMATETWVEEQGYLTEHQDITGKQDKTITDVGGYFTSDTVEGALQELGAAVNDVEEWTFTLEDDTTVTKKVVVQSGS